MGSREGTGVSQRVSPQHMVSWSLTRMLSCQWWAFWNFSAAFASLCKESKRGE